MQATHMQATHTQATERASRLYRDQAPGYDRQSRIFMPLRRRVVDLLDLEPGDRVLDVGCGTGLCFGLIEDAIGPTGELTGIDVCPEMLGEAQAHVKQEGWGNVTLVCGDASEAEPPDEVDAVLFSFTHDVLQSPEALERIVGRLRPGGRVASAGPVWAPVWATGLNVPLALGLTRFVTNFDGLDRPWRYLERLIPELRVERHRLTFYFASGQKRPEAEAGTFSRA